MTKYPRLLSGGTIEPVSLSISLNISPVSTASMTLPAGQTLDGRVYMELFAESGSVGIFRTRAPSMGVGDTKTTIQLDHAIAELGDSLVNNTLEQESTVSSAITAIFGYYKGGLWQLGSIYSGSTAVTLQPNYDTVLDAILDVLEQAPSLMMAFDFSTTPWTVNIVSRETSVSAEGRLSRNVKSASVTSDDSELCTRVYMEHLPGTSGNSYGHIDADTISTYGLVEAEISGADTSAQASRMAQLYLDKHKRPIYSVTIEAVELSQITGEPLDSFALGKKFRLALPMYDLTVEETITGMDYSDVFGSPRSVTITLSEEADTVVNYIKKNSRTGRANGKRIEKNDKIYRTLFEQTDCSIYLWAGRTNDNGNILQQAGMYLDAYGILQYATDNQNNIGSIILQTASSIRSEVHASNSELYSVIEQTSTSIMTEVGNTASGLQSQITQTAESITTQVSASESTMYSVIQQTATGIMTEVGSSLSGMYSIIEQTPEMVHIEVEAAVSGIANSVIEQTATYIHMEVTNAASDIATSVIEQTASYIHMEVENTASELASSVLEITEQQIHTEVAASNSQLYAVIEQTATSIMTEVANTASDLQSQITQTSESISTAVSASESTMYSVIEQTATSINQTIANTASGLQSQITQTDSSLSAVVSGSGANARIKPAAIQASINSATGQSKIVLSADNIILDGDAVASSLTVDNDISVGDIDARTGTGTFDQVVCETGIVTPAITSVQEVNGKDIGAFLVSATVSNNLLYLTDMDGDVVTFSKATSLSGGWSGGEYVVTASPQGNQFVYNPPLRLNGSGADSNFSAEIYESIQGGSQIARKSVYGYLVPNVAGKYIDVNTASDGSGSVVARRQLSGYFQSKTFTSNDTYTPDDGYMGFSEVTVDVPSSVVTPVISHSWSGSGKLTVWTTPAAQSNLERLLQQGATSWSNNVATVPVIASYGNQGQYTEATNCNVVVDASSIYTAGQNSVNVTHGNWTTVAAGESGYASVTFSPSAGTGTSELLQVGLFKSTGTPTDGTQTISAGAKIASGSWMRVRSMLFSMVAGEWSNNKTIITLSADGTTECTLEVDASSIYTSGYNAGYTAGKTYEYGIVRSRFNAASGSYYIEAYENISGVPGINNSSITYKLATAGSTSSTKVIITNASGTQIGSTPELSVGSLYTDGQNAVTLNNPSWTNALPYTSGATNTVTVSTSGRPTQLSNSVPVTLSQGAWANGRKTVDITTTNGNIAAQTTVYAPSATLSFDCTDLGSSASGNDQTITATAKHGTATLGSGTQVIHMGQGSWSSGQIGVTARLTDANGKCIDRIYVSAPVPTLSTVSSQSGTFKGTYSRPAVGKYISVTVGGKQYTWLVQ